MARLVAECGWWWRVHTLCVRQARKKENAKSKKKRKKEKQKEKKKAQAGGKDIDDDDDDDDDDDKPPEKPLSGGGAGGGGSRGTCTACSETSVNGNASGKASHKQVDEGSKTSRSGGKNGDGGALEDDSENAKLNHAHRPRSAAAAVQGAAGAAEAPPPPAKKGKGGGGKGKEALEGDPAASARDADAGLQLTGLAKLIDLGMSAKGEGECAALRAAWPTAPEAVALHMRGLEAQVDESHAVIRALVDLCIAEREAKEGALRDAEAARAAISRLGGRDMLRSS